MNIKISTIFIKNMIIKIIIFYGLIVLMMFILQRSFMYFPFGNFKKIPEGYTDLYLTTQDNIEIYAWYHRPQENQKTILYFHGNAGNIGNRFDRMEEFAKNYGVLAISYRGYIKSKGKPSQQGFFNDAVAGLDFLKSKAIYPQDIILFGESIGSGVASHLASLEDFSALVLEAPFSSVLSIAQKTYWFLPVSLILKDRFETDKIASKIFSPVLIFHATGDRIVPFEEGKNLFDKFNSYKKFIPIDGNFHIALSPKYLVEQIEIFFSEMNQRQLDKAKEDSKDKKISSKK